MSDLILHHYPASPFAEKARLALGLKGLAWRSVTIPPMMPKPDLMPLTGGYRRTPVLQIGADIYLDTLLILRELEKRHPAPSFYAGSDAGTCTWLAWGIEKFTFSNSTGTAFATIGHKMPPAFLAERSEFLGRPLDPERLRAARPFLLDQLRAHHGWLGQMLADGRPFLMGTAPTLVDLAAYHPVWFLHGKIDPATPGLDEAAGLQAWAARVAAIGHGSPTDLSATAALEIAAAAEPATIEAEDAGDPTGRKPGATVSVVPDDTGKNPVTGILVASSAQEIVIAREDERVGKVHLHFPRAGYVVQG